MLDLSKYEGHTPGPWTVLEFADAHEAAAKDGGWEWATGFAPLLEPVGSVWQVYENGITGLPGNIETTLPNARLIADAPALLAELKALRESHARLLLLAEVAANYFATRHGSCGCYQGECVMCKRWLDKLDVAQEAINQAKAL